MSALKDANPYRAFKIRTNEKVSSGIIYHLKDDLIKKKREER